MDKVGLDTVEHIEEHYIEERGIKRSHLDWLHDNYIVPGKLGNKSDKGGLYEVPRPGSQAVLLVLNFGLAETTSGKESMLEIMHRGQILRYNVDARVKPTEILGKGYMFDGIGTLVQHSLAG